MHEIAMVEDLFRIILDVADENRIGRIDRVTVVIGQYLQIKPSLFQFAFEAAGSGTIAEGAGLNIEIRPVELRCSDCSRLFFLNELKYVCPHCISSDLEIIDGKDIYIKSIEGE